MFFFFSWLQYLKSLGYHISSFFFFFYEGCHHLYLNFCYTYHVFNLHWHLNSIEKGNCWLFFDVSSFLAVYLSHDMENLQKRSDWTKIASSYALKLKGKEVLSSVTQCLIHSSSSCVPVVCFPLCKVNRIEFIKFRGKKCGFKF